MHESYADKIRRKINEKFLEAEINQLPFVIIRSGDFYKQNQKDLNLPPNPNHQMHNLCRIMCSLITDEDEVLDHPPSYQGTTLTIKYKIPR